MARLSTFQRYYVYPPSWQQDPTSIFIIIAHGKGQIVKLWLINLKKCTDQHRSKSVIRFPFKNHSIYLQSCVWHVRGISNISFSTVVTSMLAQAGNFLFCWNFSTTSLSYASHKPLSQISVVALTREFYSRCYTLLVTILSKPPIWTQEFPLVQYICRLGLSFTILSRDGDCWYQCWPTHCCIITQKCQHKAKNNTVKPWRFP